MRIQFNNTYTKLPVSFYARLSPTSVINPVTLCFNSQLASELGISLDGVEEKEIAAVFSGNKILKGSEPIALAYAGHQFEHFVPQLGDGRAILLGEIIDGQGKRKDIQLKGSGLTPYSRRGDGRAPLGAMIREYIVSEAMHALGIRTTRSLAVVKTGESVIRDAVLPGAILARVASSHIRIGTFEYFAARQDFKSLKILADYTINRHCPEAKASANPYHSLLEYMRDVQVKLIVDWMRVGFIHGVMNTDNMALSGETIDYGPCAFLDEYHENKVFSSIDYYGRYAFNNQASICLWNLVKFAEAISLLIDSNPNRITEVIDDLTKSFEESYRAKYLKMMGQKIGIINPAEGDYALISELLVIMQKEQLDYTLTFRYLCNAANNSPWQYGSIFTPTQELKVWIEKWLIRLQKQDKSSVVVFNLMSSLNPVFIPRNHKLEEVIQAAIKKEENSKLLIMMRVLSDPYREHDNFTEYMVPPTFKERVRQTFCGT